MKSIAVLLGLLTAAAHVHMAVADSSLSAAAAEVTLDSSARIFLTTPSPEASDNQVFGTAVQGNTTAILHYDATVDSPMPTFVNLSASAQGAANITLFQPEVPLVTVANAVGDTLAVFKGLSEDASEVIAAFYPDQQLASAVNTTQAVLRAVPQAAASAAATSFRPVCGTNGVVLAPGMIALDNDHDDDVMSFGDEGEGDALSIASILGAPIQSLGLGYNNIDDAATEARGVGRSRG